MTASAAAPTSANISPISGDLPSALPIPEVAEITRDEIFDYAADLETIDDSSVAANGRTPDFTRIQAGNPNIFVTGVTGFLGAFILSSAFKQFPKSNIYCLVRAKSDEAGFERVKDNCLRHLVWKDEWNGQLHAVAGDLGSEKFGVDDAAWTEFCSSIDVIIHNGALVNLNLGEGNLLSFRSIGYIHIKSLRVLMLMEL